ncbi:hypothetical protein B566_EDAN012204 [Ephemera danica]|nr:hypothetical protein B566_EDAN012204 [Ephemera danica]
MQSSSSERMVNKSKHFANISAKFESFSKEEKQSFKTNEIKRTENIKTTMRPTLLSQFSIEISPDLVIETNTVNPLCAIIDDAETEAEPVVEDNKKLDTTSANALSDMVDSEPKSETSVKANKNPKVTSEESRDRFESAKSFFKNLEKNVTVNKTKVPKTRRLSESAIIAHKNIDPAVYFSSVRQLRLPERFPVKDLFRDIIEDKAVNARGIPNREAAVASLNSVSEPPLLPAVATKPFSRIIEDSIAEIF